MPDRALIDRAEVERIALLARLTLGPEETEALTRDLAAVLGYVSKLEELDTSGVEPTAHAVGLATRLRDDEPGESLPVDVALRGAPERVGDGFAVPKIIE